MDILPGRELGLPSLLAGGHGIVSGVGGMSVLREGQAAAHQVGTGR